jgi:hypothetical protein
MTKLYGRAEEELTVSGLGWIVATAASESVVNKTRVRTVIVGEYMMMHDEGDAAAQTDA